MDVKVNTTQSIQTVDNTSKNGEVKQKDFKFTLLSKVDESQLQSKLNGMIESIT